MRYNALGHTGLNVSEVGFGCGSTASLMVRGTAEEQLDAVARAVEGGINFFDTAFIYGMGESERNLGKTLHRLGDPPVHLATKVRIAPWELKNDVLSSFRTQVVDALGRLGVERVDLLQLHNRISLNRPGAHPIEDTISHTDVLDRGVVDALEQLKQEGLTGSIGFSGLGDPASILKVVESERFDTLQVYFNLLNPSAGVFVPPGFRHINYDRIIDAAVSHGVGVIGIRALAAGALSGPGDHAGSADGESSSGNAQGAPHYPAPDLDPLRRPNEPIPRTAMRFVIANPKVATALIGFGKRAHVESALTVVRSDPDFPPESLEYLASTLQVA